MIKVKDLVKELSKLDQDQYIEVANDEEWNNIYTDFDIQQDGEHGAFVIFGLSGSEVESMEDVANGKHDRNIEPIIQCPNCDKIRIEEKFPVSDESGDTYCPDCNYTIKLGGK